MGILRNKLGNYYRRARRQEPFVESQTISAEGLSAETPPQEAALQHSELRDLIDEIVKGFEPREQRVLYYFLSGIPTHEIVERLHPERYQNVVNWLYRGRKKLARELARYGYGR
jgi:RNA polymerase sigma factor (sigma-70 family)